MGTATYRITVPKGTNGSKEEAEYEITAPDNMDDAAVQALVAEHLKTQGVGETQPATVNRQAQPLEDKTLGGAMLGGFMKPFDGAAAYLDKGLKGVGIDLDALGQVIGLPSREQAQASRKEFFAGNDTTASNIGNFIGETAGTMALTRGMGGPITQGALGGALLSDKTDAAGVAMDMGLGAAGGKAGDVAARSIAGVIAPRVAPKVRALLDEGIPLTPGQIVGQGGVAGRAVKSVEDAASNLPIIGSAIKSARQRGDEAFVRAATNRALGPIGKTLPDTVAAGHEGVDYAAKALSDAYGQVLPRLNGTIDQSLAQRIMALRQRADVPQRLQGRLDEVMEDAQGAFQAGQNGQYSGRTLRDASEKLGDVGRSLSKSDDPYERRVGQFAIDVREQLHALARRQNPAEAAALRNVDKGYASLVRVERAAAGANDGVFTPGQFKTAVRQSDSSVRKRMSARGQALDQDLANNAASVMPSTMGAGGSTGVNSLGMLGALGIGAFGGQTGALGTLAGLAASPALYTKTGQKTLQYMLARPTTPQQRMIADFVRKTAPATTAGGTVALSTLAGNGK